MTGLSTIRARVLCLFLAVGAIPLIAQQAEPSEGAEHREPHADAVMERTSSTPSPGLDLPVLAAEFDRERAWQHLIRQVEFGPRIPGTEGHRKAREYFRETLEQLGWEVEVWEGEPVTPVLTERTVPVYNLIARWKPESARKLFFSAHYDTRPISDQAKKPLDRIQPVPGANDGASGCAVLLEMARAISVHPPANLGIILVFHDVEDLGAARGQPKPDKYSGYCLGSRQLAAAWKPSDRYEAGVNLDMVGDADLAFQKEALSVRAFPEIVERFWSLGEDLWPGVFLPETGRMVIDDHLPYIERGLPCINLIDFNFGPWHTPGDTPGSCSPDSLYIVGTTCLTFLSQHDLAVPEKP